MKKAFFLMSTLIILILTGCSKSKLTTISLDNLYEKINAKESFVLYFDGVNGSLKTKLEKVLTNNDVDGYSISVSKISSAEKFKLEPIISFEDSTIVFIIDGKDPSVLSHVTNSETTVKEIEARLMDMNFIKK